MTCSKNCRIRWDRWSDCARQVKRFLGDQAGTSFVITALSFPVVLGFAGLGVDAAMWYADKRQNQTVAVNIGQRDGIEIGDMLAVFTPGGSLTDRRRGKRESVALPDERTGLVMIVRSFDRVSYGLIMESARPIHLNDVVTNP